MYMYVCVRVHVRTECVNVSAFHHPAGLASVVEKAVPVHQDDLNKRTKNLQTAPSQQQGCACACVHSGDDKQTKQPPLPVLIEGTSSWH